METTIICPELRFCKQTKHSPRSGLKC